MIKCPKCQADAPDFKTREGVEMNFCTKGCKGLWFDTGELAMYAETAINVPKIDELLSEAKATTYPCPRCPGHHLFEIPYMPGEDLLIDWCKNCRGVFLDAKELAKVQELANKYEDQSTRLRRAAQHLMEQGYNTGLRKTK